jgi:DNA-binding helix-hairpin-helix protein with protein kinase domain
MAESDQKDLVITALRQRIGELVSNYETEIAIIRANFTKLKEEFDHISKVLADQETLEEVKTPVKKFVPPDIIKNKEQEPSSV